MTSTAGESDILSPADFFFYNKKRLLLGASFYLYTLAAMSDYFRSSSFTRMSFVSPLCQTLMVTSSPTFFSDIRLVS